MLHRSWHSSPSSRPSMSELFIFFSAFKGGWRPADDNVPPIPSLISATMARDMAHAERIDPLRRLSDMPQSQAIANQVQPNPLSPQLIMIPAAPSRITPTVRAKSTVSMQRESVNLPRQDNDATHTQIMDDHVLTNSLDPLEPTKIPVVPSRTAQMTQPSDMVSTWRESVDLPHQQDGEVRPKPIIIQLPSPLVYNLPLIPILRNKPIQLDEKGQGHGVYAEESHRTHTTE
jgi:hypothetical protein